MGKELNIRLLYFVFVISLYFCGVYASKFIENEFGIEIELKILLPILSIVLMDWFFRLTTYHLLHICNKGSMINESLKLEWDFYYSGTHNVLLEFKKTKGFECQAISMSFVEFGGDERISVFPPENFQYLLKPESPKININLKFEFQDLPKPIAIFKSKKIYYIRNTFHVNGYFKKTIRHLVLM